MKQLIVYLLILFGLLACAGIPLSHDQCNATKFPTAHEHEACLKAAKDYEQAEHEKADKRLIRRDKLIIFLNACDANDKYVLVERIYSRSCLPNTRSRRKALREYGRKFTHGNVCSRAHISDFQCWDRRAFIEALKRAGY